MLSTFFMYAAARIRVFVTTPNILANTVNEPITNPNVFYTPKFIICPECGEELEFFDNAAYLEQIKQYIKDCEKEFKNFKKELKKYAKKNKLDYDAIVK